MSTAKIIVNPYAGRWKAKTAIPAIEAACRRIGLDYEMVVTDEPDHGIELARGAAQAGFSPVIAAGGDGSINEVVNGLMQAAGDGQTVPLGIIPLGSADDFAEMVALERPIEAACRVIQVGYTRAIDVGCVNGRFFDNNSAVGLEPMVGTIQESITWLKGVPRYVYSAIRAIFSHRPWEMRVTWDDGAYEGPTTLVSVGNTPRTGGTFWMTPYARPDDGLLDFVFAGELGRLQLLRLLPTTFDGSHIDRPEVSWARTTRLTIDSEPSTPIQTDGELFERSATHIEYSILPGRLQVIVPEGKQPPTAKNRDTS